MPLQSRGLLHRSPLSNSPILVVNLSTYFDYYKLCLNLVQHFGDRWTSWPVDASTHLGSSLAIHGIHFLGRMGPHYGDTPYQRDQVPFGTRADGTSARLVPTRPGPLAPGFAYSLTAIGGQQHTQIIYSNGGFVS